MRVLLTTDTVGGVWDHALALAGGLRERGHEVMLAVVGRPSEDRTAGLPEGVEVEAREYRLEWMPDAAADVEAAGEWLARLARAWRPDVAHLNQMAYAVHDLGAAKLVVVHSDVLSWMQETRGAPAGPEWEAYAGWVRRGIAAADAVAAPSRYQSSLTARHYGRGADRVIHNGVRPPAGEPRERVAPLLLTVGRAWDEAKGMAVVDRAVGLLGGAAPAAHLVGETEGPHGQHFAARHLVSHGRMERAAVDGWMERASLYLGASLYEPFGLAPLEAALRGCALVLSDIGSFRDLWDGCAVFFGRGDAAALAEALAALGSDPTRTAALAAAARGRALERYGEARMVEEYVGLYREMVGEGPSPGPHPGGPHPAALERPPSPTVWERGIRPGEYGAGLSLPVSPPPRVGEGGGPLAAE